MDGMFFVLLFPVKMNKKQSNYEKGISNMGI